MFQQHDHFSYKTAINMGPKAQNLLKKSILPMRIGDLCGRVGEWCHIQVACSRCTLSIGIYDTTI